MQHHIFHYNQTMQLESGKQLSAFHLQYATLGTLNADKSNVVWVFHALTANSDAEDWWSGLIGEDKFFNPEKYFIICVNIPSSCYGSLSPLDTNPQTGKPYYKDFPLFTIRDVIQCFKKLQVHLSIERIYIAIGGSMGGMQLLEWATMYPHDFEYIIPIATNACVSPWASALNASQRMCIETDISWKEDSASAGMKGMEVARSIALLSYRNYYTYQVTQMGNTDATAVLPIDQQVPKSATYQKYQGEKLAKRFNAYSYYYITKMMDTHNLGRGRDSLEAALATITAKTLVIGVTSDILFPVQEQEIIAQHIPQAQLAIIESLYGHDGFLLEFEKIEKIIKEFLYT